MQTSEILAAIDEEISRLQQVRNLLAGHRDVRVSSGRRAAAVPATAFPFGAGQMPPKKRRRLSAAGRARIAAAQKARWAKVKKAARQKNGNK